MNDVGMIPPSYPDPAFPLMIRRAGVGAAATLSCWHEDLEIKLIRTGQTIVVIDSKIITAKEDEILFVNPYQVHSMPALAENDMIYDLFSIHLDFFQKSGIQSFNLRKIFAQKRCRIHNHIQNPRLAEILKRLLAAFHTEDAYSQSHKQGLLLEFLAILLREEMSDTLADEVDPRHEQYYHAVEPALEVIHTRYSERLSGEELATMCSMSTFYFSRIFKRVTGLSPIRYLTEYRLSIADVLLKHQDSSIADIAHAVGFDDEAYFSRCYKNARGISPSQYKARES